MTIHALNNFCVENEIFWKFYKFRLENFKSIISNRFYDQNQLNLWTLIFPMQNSNKQCLLNFCWLSHIQNVIKCMFSNFKIFSAKEFIYSVILWPCSWPEWLSVRRVLVKKSQKSRVRSSSTRFCSV